MSKLNTILYKIPLPTSSHYHFLCRFKSGKDTVQVIMTHITKEEEDEIDNLDKEAITLERGDRTFNITKNKIYCYGEVNFRDKKDLDTIDRFGFLNQLDGNGIAVCSNYDYETHSCSSTKRTPLLTETWSPSFLARYAHSSLGKPLRIVLFKTI